MGDDNLNKRFITVLENLGVDVENEFWYDDEGVEGTSFYIGGNKVFDALGHFPEMEDPDLEDVICILEKLVKFQNDCDKET